MADAIPLLAPLPMGDGPGRAHKKLRRGLGDIARRVAAAALIQRSEDVLLEVYAAGAAHAVALLERQGRLLPKADPEAN